MLFGKRSNMGNLLLVRGKSSHTLFQRLLICGILHVGLVTVAFCAPQQPAGNPNTSPEIRGTVVELGTNQPIPSAVVTLSIKGPRPINGGWEPDASKSVRTDFAGAFAIELGKVGAYRVDAKAEGYKGGQTVSGSRSYEEVTLTSDNPTAQVRLLLYRPGGLSGHVVDDETGEPLANVRLGATQVVNFAGYHLFLSAPGTTDAGGTFVVPNIEPGDYTAEIGFRSDHKERVRTEFSKSELQAVDMDFEHSYWPGGPALEMAVPVSVPSGATVDVGQVRVRKVPYYHVHIRTVPASKYESGDKMLVQELSQNEQFVTHTQHLADVPCGKDLLVTGFLTGPHRLVLIGNVLVQERREVASLPFVITDKNIEIIAPLARGFVVDGTVIAAEGAKAPDFSNVRILLNSIGMVHSLDDGPVKPAADGKFRIPGVPPLTATAAVVGIGAGNYVREIRYNGVAAADGVIPLEEPALTHSLTVVLDDKPAAVGGAVVDGDKPAKQPCVVLKKWPPPNGLFFNGGILTTTGDDKGRFRFSGLAPGEYRIIALRSMSAYVHRAPGVLERAMPTAKKIELGPRAFQNLDLELIELR
jgi:hypothetical protein